MANGLTCIRKKSYCNFYTLSFFFFKKIWLTQFIFLFFFAFFLKAVVGAGIGGTATAFYLRQEFGPGVKIDVFESGTVGGRLETVKIGEYEYETGGSVIHPLNLHMKHFVDKLGNPHTI